MILAQAPADHSPRVLFSAISSTDRATFALRRAMWKLGYNAAITDETIALARRDKNLIEVIESGRICPEDADQLTEVFAGSFDAVPFDSETWEEDDSRWAIAGELAPTEAELAAALTKNRDIPSPEDSQAFAEMDGRHDVRGPRLSDEDWANRLIWAHWREEAFPILPDYDPAELAEVGILV